MQKRKFKVTENYWMSVSDMMSALMIIFLFIAIAFMIILFIVSLVITLNNPDKRFYNPFI